MSRFMRTPVLLFSAVVVVACSKDAQTDREVVTSTGSGNRA